MREGNEQGRIVEALLVVRAQIGDQRAFERLYELYVGRLLYYLRRLVDRPEEAEDALQACWLNAYRRIGRLDDPAAFRTWIYRIARNAAFDRARRRRRDVPWDEAFEGIEPAATDDATELDVFEIAELHEALGRIDPIHREALTLRFLEGLTYDEIATVIGAPVGTVRSRIHYAKRALREAIEAGRRRAATVGAGDAP